MNENETPSSREYPVVEWLGYTTTRRYTTLARQQFKRRAYAVSNLMHKFRRCIFAGISMRIESVYYPGVPLRMTARNQTRKHWSREIGRGWFITNMAAFHASSLHAPSSLVRNVTEFDNSSEDELTFDENIPLAGYEEQDEEEDERAIGVFLGRNKKSSNNNNKKKLPITTFA